MIIWWILIADSGALSRCLGRELFIGRMLVEKYCLHEIFKAVIS